GSKRIPASICTLRRPRLPGSIWSSAFSPRSPESVSAAAFSRASPTLRGLSKEGYHRILGKSQCRPKALRLDQICGSNPRKGCQSERSVRVTTLGLEELEII